MRLLNAIKGWGNGVYILTIVKQIRWENISTK